MSNEAILQHARAFGAASLATGICALTGDGVITWIALPMVMWMAFDLMERLKNE